MCCATLCRFSSNAYIARATSVILSNLSETFKFCFFKIQNHVNERKIKRQEAEQASLVEALSVAELRESDLQNSVAELQLKLSIVESKVRQTDSDKKSSAQLQQKFVVYCKKRSKVKYVDLCSASSRSASNASPLPVSRR